MADNVEERDGARDAGALQAGDAREPPRRAASSDARRPEGAWSVADGKPDEFHEVAHPSRWPWLPKHEHEDLAKHPYCTECGLVQVLGSDRAMKRGGLVNLLADLRRGLEEDGRKVTEAQKRLIMKRLDDAGATDRFGLTRSHQLRLFVEAVCAVTGLTEANIEDRLHALGTLERGRTR